MRAPYMLGGPMMLIALAVAAFGAGGVSAGEGKYLNAIGFAGIFVLCCIGLHRIIRRRFEDRGW